MNDADTTYQQRLAQIRQQIQGLEAALLAHVDAQAGDTRNWCYPSELGYVISDLNDILHFLQFSVETAA